MLNLGLRWDIETNMINNDYVTPTQIRDSLTTFYRDSLYVTVPRQNQPYQIVRTVDQLGGLGRYFTDGDDRPAYKKAFQPRLGASYDLFGDGRTVLFGGFGIYYDRNYWNQMFDEEFRRDFRVLQITFDTLGPRPACTFCVRWDPKYFNKDSLRALAASGRAGVPEVFLIANDTKPPKTNQFSVGVRQTFGNTLMSLTYAAARSVNGFTFVRGTRCDSINCNALNPTYARSIADDRVKTWYDAMQLGFDKPLRADTRWGGGLSYTLRIHDEHGQGNFFFALDPRYPTVADFPRRSAPENQRAHHRRERNRADSVGLPVQHGGHARLRHYATGREPDARHEPAVRAAVHSTRRRPGRSSASATCSRRRTSIFGWRRISASRGGQSVSLVVDLFNAFNSKNFGCFNDARIPRTGQTNANFGRPTCSAPRSPSPARPHAMTFGPSIAGTGGR